MEISFRWRSRASMLCKHTSLDWRTSAPMFWGSMGTDDYYHRGIKIVQLSAASRLYLRNLEMVLQQMLCPLLYDSRWVISWTEMIIIVFGNSGLFNQALYQATLGHWTDMQRILLSAKFYRTFMIFHAPKPLKYWSQCATYHFTGDNQNPSRIATTGFHPTKVTVTLR